MNKETLTPQGTKVTDEYQTPVEWLELFRKILAPNGQIGLDPCYSHVDKHRYAPFAVTTWGLEDDALSKPSKVWEANGPIYMNPPYSNPAPWVDLLTKTSGTGWIALLNSFTSTRWWQKLAEHSDIIAFPSRRISFIHPVSGKQEKGNRFDSTIFVSVVGVARAVDLLSEKCFTAEQGAKYLIDGPLQKRGG